MTKNDQPHPRGGGVREGFGQRPHFSWIFFATFPLQTFMEIKREAVTREIFFPVNFMFYAYISLIV